MKRLLIFLISSFLIVSCDYLDPRPVQELSTQELLGIAYYGEGLLAAAYRNLPTSYDVYSDNYTDNSVPSIPGGNRIALGSWTQISNPIGSWDTWYSSIRYLNTYLEECRYLLYSISDTARNRVLQKNRRGEAFFLRAWYQWQLLQTYAGYPAGATEAMGYPKVTKVLTGSDNLNIARNTYEECVTQIATDLDSAILLLPLKYNGALSWNNTSNRGRAEGLGAMALKARVYLFAASPAYGPSTPALWARAAKAAYDAIVATGGNIALAAYGNYNTGSNFDYIWIQPNTTSNSREYAYYPPSKYGRGEVNPSQNLIDALPMIDGYPYTLSTLYNATTPYSNRDGRFTNFIFYNGQVYNSSTIETFVGGKDAPGGLSIQGTRTGYYLRKLTSATTILTPGSVTTSNNFTVYLGKTELYLNYIEAANEAYGPNDATLGGTVASGGFSAWTLMKRIRTRAGIDSNGSASGAPDAYHDAQMALGKDAYRTFIQSERRAELCFEGFRFWDIRRLNLPLNHTVKGAKITKTGTSSYTYEYRDVETHNYADYMRYIPVPYNQTLVMSNLKQNSGW
jgi:starch-binding outer membrane protein, SusD/RagB family